MGQVRVTVNARKYDIACDDGQEQHLAELSAYVDGRLAELVGAVGQIGESRLLLMACLLISDELFDAQSRSDQAGAGTPAAADDGTADEMISQTADALNEMAVRIESIADRLNQD